MTVSKGTSLYDFYGKTKPSSDEAIIQKSHYDCFSENDLKVLLKSKNIESVVLIGGFGSRCVLASAFGAKTNDYHVMVLEYLLVVPQEYNNEMPSTCKIINAILGYVGKSDELLKYWGSEPN